MPYIPGVALLLPCFCTAGLIYCSQYGIFIKKFLSLPFMVKTGLLSYSLYLWHWVVITLFNYVLADLSKQVVLIILQCTLILLFSIVGYYLIEKPIRYKNLSFKKSFIFVYLIPSLLLVGVNYLARNYIRTIHKKHIAEDALVIKNTLPSKVLMIGDSHSEHLKAFLDYVGNKEGWKADIMNLNETNCKFPINKDGYINQYSDCSTVINKLEEYPIIFISFFYDLYSGENPVPRNNPISYRENDFYLKLHNLVKFLAKKDKQVYVFSNVPALSYSPLRKLHLRPLGLDKNLPPITFMGDIKQSNEKVFNAIRDIKNAHWVDILPYLPKGFYINNKSIYQDQDHLTALGAYNIGIAFSKTQILLPKSLVDQVYKNSK